MRGTRSKTALALSKYFSDTILRAGELQIGSAAKKKTTVIKRNFIVAVGRLKWDAFSEAFGIP